MREVETTEAVVIGGGIVGASAAYHLGNRGVSVTLLDRAEPGRATEAGAGIICPETDHNESEDWYELAVAAKGYYPRLFDALPTAGSETYAERGMLLTDSGTGNAENYETTVRRLRERVSDDALETLETAAIDELPLSSIERGIYYPHAAYVDGASMRTALITAAKAAGVEVRTENATDIHVRQGSAVGVETDDRRYDTDTVVIAGGAWSPEFASQLRLEIPVQPVRGQLIHLAVSNFDLDRWPIVNTASRRYFVPWSNDRLVVGATHEPESGYDPHVTVEGIRSLLESVCKQFPVLGGAEIEETRVGLRPTTPDHKPIIGAVPAFDNVYLATGHGSTGLQLGPYTGKLISELVIGAEPTADLSPFIPERFH